MPHEAFKFISLRTQRDASALKSGKWTCPIKTNPNQTKKTRKYKQRRAQLLAEVAQLKKETEKLKKETEKLNKEGAEQSKKTDKKFEEVAEQQKETDKQLERVGKKIEEVSELQRVNSEELTKTVEGLRQVRIASEKAVIASEKNGEEVKEVVEGLRQASIASEKVRIASKNHGKRIGRIGNNLGRYTEAMATPSIRGILEREFNADFRGWLCAGSPKYEVDLEVDAWGVSRNGTGEAYVVEIKRKFHEKHINQVWQIVKRFRVNLPEYRRRAVYPMLAVVDISDEGRAMVWDAGDSSDRDQ